jgi:hypothetical protein
MFLSGRRRQALGEAAEHDGGAGQQGAPGNVLAARVGRAMSTRGTMNVRSLSRGLAYRGEASGKRQTYYVFEGDDFFAVFSFSKTKPNSGNFNIVSPKAVEYVRSRFRRAKGVTAKDVVAKAKRSGHVPNSLAALNVL